MGLTNPEMIHQKSEIPVPNFVDNMSFGKMAHCSISRTSLIEKDYLEASARAEERTIIRGPLFPEAANQLGFLATLTEKSAQEVNEDEF